MMIRYSSCTNNSVFVCFFASNIDKCVFGFVGAILSPVSAVIQNEHGYDTLDGKRFIQLDTVGIGKMNVEMECHSTKMNVERIRVYRDIAFYCFQSQYLYYTRRNTQKINK